jgi:hypothetical protein
MNFVPQADREQAISDLEKLVDDLPPDNPLKHAKIEICLGSEGAQTFADLARRAGEPDPDRIGAILDGLESVGAFDAHRAKRLPP